LLECFKKILKALQKGFADILIKPFNNEYIKYFGLLEFKYIKREEKPTKQKIEQLNRYESDSLVTQYSQKGITLKKVILIFHGWELIYCEVV
jgi:response regulator of citrate/malate metabolism